MAVSEELSGFLQACQDGDLDSALKWHDAWVARYGVVNPVADGDFVAIWEAQQDTPWPNH